MRNNFAKELSQICSDDDKVLLLSGDIGNRLFDDIKKITDFQFINCGIAEQSMMGMAAGLALSGFKPVVYTITPFVTYRCFEQIRIDVSYHEAPVVIVGTGSGLSYASLGPTHHSMEDIAILRTLPSLIIFCPSGPDEVRAGLKKAINNKSPVYIRLGKKGEKSLHNSQPEIEFGKAICMRQGSDSCIIGTGPILANCIAVSDKLLEQGFSIRVENFHTIKPLDYEKLSEICATFSELVIVEEHGKIGGLFSAISEYISENKEISCKLSSVSSEDRFLHVIGSQDIARKSYGITDEKIEEKVKASLQGATR
jgi:transketolase